MSRTYSHDKKRRLNLWFQDKGPYPIEYQHWISKEPKWWRKLAKHKKRRSALRQALHQVKVGNEEALFPLDKKPWIYYW